ncbi:MAG: Maf family protein [Nitrospiria bacterium]
MKSSPRIVLASTSLRRKEILSLLGIPYHMVSPPFEERWNRHRSAQEEVIAFSEGKAGSVECDFPRSIIIGSDTLIEDEEGKIGKPSGDEEAKQILRRLQGRRHHIWTAVVLIDATDHSTRATVEKVEIIMHQMHDDEIESYVSTGEPLDKAGAYSIQGEGRRFIRRLKGDYLAAVGLPLRPVADFLRRRQIHFPLDIERLYREKNFLNWKTFS